MINASPSKRRSLYSGPRYLMIAVFIVVGALLAIPLFMRLGRVTSSLRVSGASLVGPLHAKFHANYRLVKRWS